MTGPFFALRGPLGAFAALTFAALIVGCNSGGSSTPSSNATATASPIPTATPTNPPTRGSASCTSGASPATTTVPIAAGSDTITSPTVGGCSLSVSLSGVTGTTTSASVTTQLTPPSGLATPIATGGQGGPPTGFSLPYTPVFYVSVTFNGTFGTGGGNPKMVFTVPTITPGNNFFDVSWLNATGSASQFNAYGSDCNGNALALSVAGNTLTLPGCPGSGGGSTIPAGSTYVISLAYF